MPIKNWPEDLDLKRQAVCTAPAKSGETGVYTGTAFPASVLTDNQPTTIHELFEEAVQRNTTADLFQYRPLLTPATATSPAIYSPTLSSLSYSTSQTRRTHIGQGIIALAEDGRLSPRSKSGSGAWPEKIDSLSGFGVGIWSSNRPEWQLVDLGCHAFGLVSVPLYDTLGPNVVEYITNHSPLSIIFAASAHIPALLKIAKKCDTLRVVVSLDELGEKEGKVLKAWGGSVGIEVWGMMEFERWGREEGERRKIGLRPPTPEQTSTISYTSGTTGNPKGVVLTHRAIVSGVVAQAHGSSQAGKTGGVLMAYLPLAHILERFFELLMIYSDGIIAYTTGDPLRLLEDAQIIKPHIFPSVPRVLNRIHQAIMAQINAGGVKGSLLSRAINAKVDHYRKTGEVTHRVYDALVFRKVRALLGGRVELITSGSAPISGDVMEVLKACFSCDVVEGYGLTETVGTCTSGVARDSRAVGTTGPPRVGMQCKLVDVPELSYLTSDRPNPRGELLLKGPMLISRYHKDEENTKKAIDADNWFHTGDIAEIDSVGRVKIIDRIKNVMKLSQGEYVALEKIEGVYSLYPLFSAILVHGDSLRAHIILIGICDPMQASALVKRVLGKDVAPTDIQGLKAILNDNKVRREVLGDMKRLAKKAGLNSFEQVKGLHLEVDPFPEEVLTPTFKVKRQAAAKHYKAVIDAVYAEEDSLFKDAPLPAKL